MEQVQENCYCLARFVFVPTIHLRGGPVLTTAARQHRETTWRTRDIKGGKNEQIHCVPDYAIIRNRNLHFGCETVQNSTLSRDMGVHYLTHYGGGLLAQF